MDIHKALLLEELMDGIGRHGAHPEHRRERIGSGPQMSDGAQVFHAVALFLQGIFGGGCALHGDNGGLKLDGLLGIGGIHQRAAHNQRRAHVLLGDILIILHDAVFKDHLEALKIAAIVELNKAKGLLGAHGADPAAHSHLYLVKGLGIGKNLRNQCSFHNVLSCYEIRVYRNSSTPE